MFPRRNWTRRRFQTRPSRPAKAMARRDGLRPQQIGIAGLALLGVVLLIAALAVGSWRSGLLTLKSAELSIRMPQAPAVPRRMPDPGPMPLPKPGSGVSESR